MESRTKILGHAAHPMAVVIPLGLFIGTVALDLLYKLTGNRDLGIAGNYTLIGGILGALVAAPLGTRDWLAIPQGTRARTVGRYHMIANVVGLVLWVVAYFLRRDNYADPSWGVVATEVAALGLGGVGAWLGGELIERLGVGVDRGAHLNAPNSLSGEPATLRD